MLHQQRFAARSVLVVQPNLLPAASNSRKTNGLKLTIVKVIRRWQERVNMVSHSIAFAFNDDGLGMEQAVEQRGSQRAVVVEGLGPVLKRPIRTDTPA
jgi:hypothetical protein